MENILARINEIATQEGITITSLEARIGASKGVLSRALAKGTDISSKWVSAVVENYPLYSADWLLTGKGDILKKFTRSDKFVSEAKAEYGLISNLKNDRKKDIQQIPLYSLAASAGIFEIIANEHQTPVTPVDYIRIPNMPACDGAVPVTGDSMYPIIKSGDILLYKEVNDKRNIIWGEMYIAAIKYNGDSFFFSKYVQKSEREGWAKFVSENRHHQPVEFPIDSIRAIAHIKATIRFQSAF